MEACPLGELIEPLQHPLNFLFGFSYCTDVISIGQNVHLSSITELLSTVHLLHMW